MNAALFTKSTTGLILASGLIAASSILGYAQDAPVALGTQATLSLSGYYTTTPTGQAALGGLQAGGGAGERAGVGHEGGPAVVVDHGGQHPDPDVDPAAPPGGGPPRGSRRRHP